MLSVQSDNKWTVPIRHLLVQGSFEWAIGRNVTRRSDVFHYSGGERFLPPVHGKGYFIEMIDYGLWLFIDLNKF